MKRLPAAARSSWPFSASLLLALLLLAGCSSSPRADSGPSTHVRMSELALQAGGFWYWDEPGQKGVIEAPGWRLVAIPGLDRLLFLGEEHALSRPVFRDKGEVWIPREFADRYIMARAEGPADSTEPPPRAPEVPEPPSGTGTLSGWTIAVDAGHGGNDPGATSGGVREKAVTLAVALRLAFALQGIGASVVLTRRSDVTVPLNDRVEIARRGRCDLFVSVHANSCPHPHIRGVEVYAKATGDGRTARESGELAHRIALAVASRTGTPNRGAKPDGRGLRVLARSTSPAVLVECGYLTNHGERNRLVDPEYQDQVAMAVCGGILEHVQRRGTGRWAP